MATPIQLTPHSIRINAPRELVFQTVSSFGRGRARGLKNVHARIICESGDKIVAEFVDKSWIFTYRSIEEVVLEPPDRIEFRHIAGPLHYAKEQFVFVDVDGGTEMTHSGEFIWKNIPVIGRLGALLYTKRTFEKIVSENMGRMKAVTEERASRSHVFVRKSS